MDMSEQRFTNEEKLLHNWESDANEPDSPAWDEKKFKRMIWRTRFTVVRSVVSTLLGIFLLVWIYMMLVTSYYHSSGKSDQFIRYVTTLVETHEPGLKVEKGGHWNAELTPFLTKKATLKLFKQVGEWQIIAGEVTATQTLFGDVTYSINENVTYLRTPSRFSFAVPPDLIAGDPSRTQAPSNRSVWEQLKHIEDGYVAELAFSTVVGMDPEELLKRLSNYQVRVLSMPVYAGELKGDLKNIPHSTSNELHFVPHLTLRPFVKYQEEGNGMSWAGWLENADTLKQSVDQMLKDIEWLRQERSYRESENDGKRLDYLKENGVKVYGAVVTGPVRELEKLKQEQDLFYFQLGRIEIWNWEEHTS